MKILHMADVHLGAKPDKDKAWGEGREQLLWQAFSQTIAAAEQEKVDLVLIAGDLFHRQPLKKELKEVNAILSRLTKAQVVIMAGNHDYISKDSFYRSFSWNENIHMIKSQQPQIIEFPQINTFVHGLSYEQREIRDPLYDHMLKGDKRGIHILLAHGGDEAHIPLGAGRLKGLGFDHIALGHIHKPGQLLEDRIVMAGALQPLDHTEIGPHGYWITEFHKGFPSTAFYPIRGCEYVQVLVEMNPGITNIGMKELVRERISCLESWQLANVVLQGSYDAELDLDTEGLKDLEKVVSVEKLCKPNYEIEKIQKEYETQVLGRYIREMTAMPQNEVTRRALYLGIDALMGN